MPNDNTIFIVIGIIGAILGAIDTYRSKGNDLSAVAWVIGGIGLAIIGLN